MYNLFDCLSFFQRLLKTSGVKNDVAKESNLPERYENSSVTSKSTKHHSDIKMHGKNRKKIKNFETTSLSGHKSCRQKLIYHASLRNF